MLSIKPISESAADRETRAIYESVKNTLNTSTTPLLFQYLAVFPKYLIFLWQQLQPNLTDTEFKKHIQEVENFSLTAIDHIYTPNAATKVFVNQIAGRVEQLNLLQFTNSLRKTNATLYLMTLGIRESVKGVYLGIKRISQHVSPQDTHVFSDISEGFFTSGETPMSTSKSLVSLNIGISPNSQNSVATAPYQQFFKLMQWEMDALIKKQEYLFRRVELERFALSKLDNLPYPLESSFASVAHFSGDDPRFFELLYIIAELFPTQAPYKLLASSTMTKALIYQNPQPFDSNPSSIALPSGISSDDDA